MVLQVIAQRLAMGVLVLLVVSAIIFSAVSMLPGDAATEILGQSATPETVAAFRHELGLDVPPHTRYFQWLGGMFRGDFGTSIANGRDVGPLIFQRFQNTIFLAAFAAVIAVPLAIGLGLAAALFRGSVFDRVVNVLTQSAISIPDFFVAYLLILVFSVKLAWFPSLSNVSPGDPFLSRIVATAIPALTLTLVILAHMMRLTRAAIINLLASPYIEMATLKGMSRMRIILFHALPNALAPIINVVVINLAYLIVGVVIVEVVFVYPGLGQLMVDSVQKRDIPVVQACCVIFGLTYILLNLIADILSVITNPRLLHPR